MVNDKYYQEEVELLHPGTKLPSAHTLGQDILVLYTVFGSHVKSYFRVLSISVYIRYGCVFTPGLLFRSEAHPCI